MEFNDRRPQRIYAVPLHKDSQVGLQTTKSFDDESGQRFDEWHDAYEFAGKTKTAWHYDDNGEWKRKKVDQWRIYHPNGVHAEMATPAEAAETAARMRAIRNRTS